MSFFYDFWRILDMTRAGAEGGCITDMDFITKSMWLFTLKGLQ